MRSENTTARHREAQKVQPAVALGHASLRWQRRLRDYVGRDLLGTNLLVDQH